MLDAICDMFGNGNRKDLVPVGVEKVEILRSCTGKSYAVLREAPKGEDAYSVDVELCDEAGEVWARLSALSLREHGITESEPQTEHVVMLSWKWHDTPLVPEVSAQPPSGHWVIVCAEAHEENYVQALPQGIRCVGLSREGDEEKKGAERYEDYAQRLLAYIQEALTEHAQRLQLVLITGTQQHGEWTRGLAGSLKTVQQENPKLKCQVLEVTPAHTIESVLKLIQDEASSSDFEVSFTTGNRRIPKLEEVQASAEVPWKEDGVYLVSGGAGGLGFTFVREIGRRVGRAKMILLGRGELREPKHRQLVELSMSGLEVEYERVDVSDRLAVQRCVEGIVSRHGRLDGVLHAAGVLRDSFVIRKSAAEVKTVFASKVGGLVNLDEATAHLGLQFFVAFSSAAGVFGNLGQSDYAMANAFMDEYIRSRAKWVEEGSRSGRSVSIAWPLWADGGMKADGTRALLREKGLVELSNTRGLETFYRAYGSGLPNIVAVALRREDESIRDGRLEVAEEVVQERSLHQLSKLLAQVVGLDVSRVDVTEALESYGIDSVMIVALNRKLAQHFGQLSKTLWYEYPTLSKLNDYLVKEHREQTVKWSGLAGGGVRVRSVRSRTKTHKEPRKARRRLSQPGQGVGAEPIAVIGLSGRYPQARTLEGYWENLKSGRDSIQEIPCERWDLEGFYHPQVEEAVQAGKSYCKWGGFLEGFAEFDALFFNLSPREAQWMDPQERLFMQSCWEVLEDGGYTRERLQQRHGGRVGVFAGITKTGFDCMGRSCGGGGRVAFRGPPSARWRTGCPTIWTCTVRACRSTRCARPR